MTSRNLNAEREEIVRIIGGHVDLPLSSRLAIARSLQDNGFRLHAESSPELVYVREGVCLLCGDGVLKSGEHIDPERHVSEVERIVSGMSAQTVSIDDRDALACSIFLADLSDKLTIDECAPIADEVMRIFSRLGKAQAAADEQPDLIGAASAAFKARGGAPDWEEDAVARDLIIRWHLRGFEDGEKFARRPSQTEPTDDEREALRKALGSVLSEDTLDCTRVWEAWHYGTMTEDDFVPVMERSDEIIAAILAAGFRRPAQTEPTDAQVQAAIQGRYAALSRRSVNVTETHLMRAALKAAFTTGQEEQS